MHGQVLLEAGEGFVTIEGATGVTADSVEGDEGVHITLDRTKIMSVGMPAIRHFLNTIQVCCGLGRGQPEYSGSHVGTVQG